MDRCKTLREKWLVKSNIGFQKVVKVKEARIQIRK